MLVVSVNKGYKVTFFKNISIYLFILSVAIACVKDPIRGEVFDTSIIHNPNEIKILNNIIEIYERDYERGEPYTYTMERGLYRSKYKTSNGIFYEGFSHSIVREFQKGRMNRHTGGFFIPTNITQPVRWWIEGRSEKAWDNDGKRVRIFPTVSREGNIMGGNHSGIYILHTFTPENSLSIRKLLK